MSISLFILLFFISVLFVEGATELLCKSLLFYRFRLWFSARGDFFRNLISCGYCTSVWVSILPSLVLSSMVASGVISWAVIFIVLLVVIHRVSNYAHNFNDKHLDKYYSTSNKEKTK